MVQSPACFCFPCNARRCDRSGLIRIARCPSDTSPGTRRRRRTSAPDVAASGHLHTPREAIALPRSSPWAPTHGSQRPRAWRTEMTLARRVHGAYSTSLRLRKHCTRKTTYRRVAEDLAPYSDALRGACQGGCGPRGVSSISSGILGRRMADLRGRAPGGESLSPFAVQDLHLPLVVARASHLGGRHRRLEPRGLVGRQR